MNKGFLYPPQESIKVELTKFVVFKLIDLLVEKNIIPKSDVEKIFEEHAKLFNQYYKEYNERIEKEIKRMDYYSKFINAITGHNKTEDLLTKARDLVNRNCGCDK